VLFHHDPEHTDEDLAVVEVRAAELWNVRPPHLAREGMRLGLGEDVVELAASGRPLERRGAPVNVPRPARLRLPLPAE
jgi:hypothetical protein